MHNGNLLPNVEITAGPYNGHIRIMEKSRLLKLKPILTRNVNWKQTQRPLILRLNLVCLSEEPRAQHCDYYSVRQTTFLPNKSKQIIPIEA